MIDLALKLVMVWLLVGPPALCRGGVLDECCAHDEASVVTSVVADQQPCCAGTSGKCKSKRPTEPPEPPAPRKCGTCAGVCGTVVKPSDDMVTDTATLLLMMPVHLDGDSIVPSMLRSPDMTDGRPPGLRIPPGDLPLLI